MVAASHRFTQSPGHKPCHRRRHCSRLAQTGEGTEVTITAFPRSLFGHPRARSFRLPSFTSLDFFFTVIFLLFRVISGCVSNSASSSSAAADDRGSSLPLSLLLCPGRKEESAFSVIFKLLLYEKIHS